MNEDIMYLNKIMSFKTRNRLYDNYFCWLYLFTNENINEYYKYLDFENKKILTVTASGDHALNAFLHGADEVDSFDINPLAKYFSELKIAAIKSLSREEFIMFFNLNIGLFHSSKYFFNKDFYFNKIRKYLDERNRTFWDYLFNNYSSKRIKNSLLFSEDILFLESIIKVNTYLSNDENYYKLREVLNNKRINYYDIDIIKLNNINKNYDLIILSNIANYIDKIYDSNCLKRFKELINNLKNKNSKIVVTYLYNNCIGDSFAGVMYDRYRVDSYFDKNNYEYLSFDSTDVYEYPKYFRKDNRKDKILITKN